MSRLNDHDNDYDDNVNNNDDYLCSGNTKIITTTKAPAPIGPYNQAILLGNMLYTSGQIAIDPDTAELVTDCIESETRQVMENLKAILTEA